MHISRFGKIFSYLAGTGATTVEGISQTVPNVQNSITSIQFCDGTLEHCVAPVGVSQLSEAAFVGRQFAFTVSADVLKTFFRTQPYAVSLSDLDFDLDWSETQLDEASTFTVASSSFFASTLPSLSLKDFGNYERERLVSAQFEGFSFGSPCGHGRSRISDFTIDLVSATFQENAAQGATYENVTLKCSNTLSIDAPGFASERIIDAIQGAQITNSLLINSDSISWPTGCFRENPLLTADVSVYRSFEIPAECFMACDKMTNISVSGGCTKVNNSAFKSCGDMTHAKFVEQGPQDVQLSELADYCFEDCTSLVHVGSFEEDENGQFTENLFQNVKILGNYCFSNCVQLPGIAIPSIVSIGDYCFSQCYSITNLSLPGTLKTIGAYAFNKCSELLYLAIPGSVKHLGDFSLCGSCMTEVVLSDGTTSLSEHAINGVSESGHNLADIDYTPVLEKINIPNSVTVIPRYIFYRTPLHTISVGSKVTTICEGAFSRTNLKSITLPDSVETIGEYAFERTPLESFDIPPKVTVLEPYVFNLCKKLTDLVIPHTVTAVKSRALYGSGVDRVLIDNVKFVDGVVERTDISVSLEGCGALTEMYFPPASSAETHCFQHCTSLTYACFRGSVPGTLMDQARWGIVGYREIDGESVPVYGWIEPAGWPDALTSIYIADPNASDDPSAYGFFNPKRSEEEIPKIYPGTSVLAPSKTGKPPISSMTSYGTVLQPVQKVDEELKIQIFEPNGYVYDTGIDIDGDFRITYWAKSSKNDFGATQLWYIGESEQWCFGINPPSTVPEEISNGKYYGWDLSRDSYDPQYWTQYTFEWRATTREARMWVNEGVPISFFVNTGTAKGRLFFKLSASVVGMGVQTNLDMDVVFPNMTPSVSYPKFQVVTDSYRFPYMPFDGQQPFGFLMGFDTNYGYYATSPILGKHLQATTASKGDWQISVTLERAMGNTANVRIQNLSGSLNDGDHVGTIYWAFDGVPCGETELIAHIY